MCVAAANYLSGEEGKVLPPDKAHVEGTWGRRLLGTRVNRRDETEELQSFLPPSRSLSPSATYHTIVLSLSALSPHLSGSFVTISSSAGILTISCLPRRGRLPSCAICDKLDSRNLSQRRVL